MRAAAQRWIERHPDRAEEAKLRSRANTRAMRRLKVLYPYVFERLMDEECERVGIPRYAAPLPASEDGRTSLGRRVVKKP